MQVSFDWGADIGVPDPLVAVQLSRGPVEHNDFLPMMIDTGADVSILSRDFEAALGVLPEELEPCRTAGISGGASGRRLARGEPIRARIGPFEFVLPRVHFIPNAPAILGRDALFALFELRMTADIVELIDQPKRRKR